jgi:hypothetical protein
VEDVADRSASGGQFVMAASMSGTTRRLSALPGAADVSPMPNWTEHAESGGLN